MKTVTFELPILVEGLDARKPIGHNRVRHP